MVETELNEQIAEKLIGFTRLDRQVLLANGDQIGPPVWRKGFVVEHPPDYSGDINLAWLVVEAMQKRGFEFELFCSSGGEWACCFSKSGVDWRIPFGQSDPTSAPMSICTAALAALNVEAD